MIRIDDEMVIELIDLVKEGHIKELSLKVSTEDIMTLLNELGYDEGDSETCDWSADFWWTFSKEGEPDLLVAGTMFTADATISLKKEEEEEEE